ncbi:MAG: hypothetical protein KF847_10215 [Pirellulales bacterium]|nr:hypothetical protein [Pirellulales bacterium]
MVGVLGYAAATLLLVVGCADAPPEASVDYATLRTMSAFYGAYCRDRHAASPQSEEAFRAYLAEKETDLQQAGLSADKMFISPRNGGHMQWVYGSVPPTGPSGMSYIAFETSPSDGKRLVIMSRGAFDLIDDSEFHSIFADAQ